MMAHDLITGHGCIPLTYMIYPSDIDNANQGTECNPTSVNRCVEVELGRIHRSGDIDVFPKLSMVREPAIDDYKSQGTHNDSRFLSQNK